GLHQPLRFPERNRLAVADGRELADPERVASRLRLGLGQSDRGNLRIAVRTAWDLGLVQRVRLLASNRLDADDALVLCLVREHRRTGDVADGVDAGNVGPAEAIDDDCPLLDLYAQRLEAEVLGIAHHPDGEDHALGLDLLALPTLRLDRRRDAVLALG